MALRQQHGQRIRIAFLLARKRSEKKYTIQTFRSLPASLVGVSDLNTIELPPKVKRRSKIDDPSAKIELSPMFSLPTDKLILVDTSSQVSQHMIKEDNTYPLLPAHPVKCNPFAWLTFLYGYPTNPRGFQEILLVQTVFVMQAHPWPKKYHPEFLLVLPIPVPASIRATLTRFTYNYPPADSDICMESWSTCLCHCIWCGRAVFSLSWTWMCRLGRETFICSCTVSNLSSST